MRPISPPAEKRIELVGYQREGGNVIPEFAIGYAQQPRGHPILQSPALIAFRRRDRRCGRTKRRGKPSWRSSRVGLEFAIWCDEPVPERLLGHQAHGCGTRAVD